MSAPLPTVIVLAAGRSERFAAASGGQHKLQALLGTRSVREHTLEAVRASGLPWHVVEAAHTAHLQLPGMGDSIATGVRACGGWARAWAMRSHRASIAESESVIRLMLAGWAAPNREFFEHRLFEFLTRAPRAKSPGATIGLFIWLGILP